MSGFGDKLRTEREARGRSIEEISSATGIHRAYLEALEKDEFHALPGRAFGKLYIRAYADALGVDPGPLIEEYDRAREAAPGGAPEPQQESGGPLRAGTAIERWRHQLADRRKARSRASLQRSDPADGVEAPVTEMPVAEPPSEEPLQVNRPEGEPGNPPPLAVATRGMRPAVAALVLLGSFGVAAAVYFTFTRRTIEATAHADQVTAPAEAVPAAAPGATAGAIPEIVTPPIETQPKAIPPPPTPVVPVSPARPSLMSIPESGVGRRVASRRLLEPADSFPEGSVVWFSTRVIGGEPGGRIHHVWIRDGRTMQSIALQIGGRNWRTHSRKTVYGVAQWAVEARDDSGRVLARAEFMCLPEAP